MKKIDRTTYHYSFDMNWSEVIDNLCYYPRFREKLTEKLKDVPLKNFKWECIPYDPKKDCEFEFVCVNDSRLSKKADPSKFLDHICGEDIAVFKNVKKTSTLISPSLLTNANCATVSSFVQTAGMEDIHALFIALGKQLELTNRKTWVSTAGNGAPWLHIRLDPKAKYYKYEPYSK